MKVSFSSLASCSVTLMRFESSWERRIVRTLLTVSTTVLELRATIVDNGLMDEESSSTTSLMSIVEMFNASVKVRRSWLESRSS